MRNLLLISNSKSTSGYLDHCEKEILAHLGERRSIVFIPYASPGGISFDDYTAIAKARFEKMNVLLTGIHTHKDTKTAIESADAIFVGGGNTFLLLKTLQNMGLVESLKMAINLGTPYIGASAGANIAGRTIMTTNDMPVVLPNSLTALGVVPFVINPHYIDTDPTSKHMGETREQRIKEYHAFNNDTVVALREGSMLSIHGEFVNLLGTTNARIFRKGKEPSEHTPPISLDFLLDPWF